MRRKIAKILSLYINLTEKLEDISDRTNLIQVPKFVPHSEKINYLFAVISSFTAKMKLSSHVNLRQIFDGNTPYYKIYTSLLRDNIHKLDRFYSPDLGNWAFHYTTKEENLLFSSAVLKGQSKATTSSRENQTELLFTKSGTTKELISLDLYSWPENEVILTKAENSSAFILMSHSKPLEPYIGQPDVLSIVNKIKGRAHTELIIGPSGSGKTTLARHISNYFGNRTFVISKETLLGGLTGLKEFVLVLKPSAVILDDIELNSMYIDKLLVLLEDLRISNIPCIMTVMDDESKTELKDGDLYSPGMRPGRIDSITVIPYPNKTKRKEVFKFYLNNKELAETLATRTEGFTNAYIKKLSEDINIGNDIEDSLKAIKLFLPRGDR